jgi:hypothetical protein
MHIGHATPAVLLLAFAGCGGQHKQTSNHGVISAHIIRPAAPIWCPINVPGNARLQRNRFDARALLRRSQDQAQATAARHGCTSRVVRIDGHQLVVTADYNTRRVDLTIQHGIITAVNVG